MLVNLLLHEEIIELLAGYLKQSQQRWHSVGIVIGIDLSNSIVLVIVTTSVNVIVIVTVPDTAFATVNAIVFVIVIAVDSNCG